MIDKTVGLKLLNQFRLVTMIARTTPGYHNSRITAQTLTNRLREIGERSPIYNVCFICGVSFFAYLVYVKTDMMGKKIFTILRSKIVFI